MDRKRYGRLILLLLIIAIIAVIVAVWALFFKDSTEIITPDRAPSVDENIEKLPNDSNQKNEAPADGGAVTLTFSKDVTIENGEAELYFANPGKSTHDIVLQIIIRGTAIAQSGSIAPGNQIKSLDLAENTDDILTKGEYNGKFMVYYYDKQNGEKAVLNTEIPVNISVK